MSMFGGIASALASCAPQLPPGTQVLVGMSQTVPVPQSPSAAQVPSSMQAPVTLQISGDSQGGLQSVATPPAAPPCAELVPVEADELPPEPEVVSSPEAAPQAATSPPATRQATKE